jgi:hypothetical protein
MTSRFWVTLTNHLLSNFNTWSGKITSSVSRYISSYISTDLTLPDINIKFAVVNFVCLYSPLNTLLKNLRHKLLIHLRNKILDRHSNFLDYSFTYLLSIIDATTIRVLLNVSHTIKISFKRQIFTDKLVVFNFANSL